MHSFSWTLSIQTVLLEFCHWLYQGTFGCIALHASDVDPPSILLNTSCQYQSGEPKDQETEDTRTGLALILKGPQMVSAPRLGNQKD